ncbi:DUF2235 domain-containing protein [Chromobacterium haemolyticum]|uniref:DUF2235 domain-containing protein n=1 Tax=Chromobacterium haemolyticum TaxID=394935 RepID=UPI00068DEB3D|nr:DUF2235 domain-containing protein [Chromobacterium haemolyticum]BBH14534.1 hypothetical protein CH06BL_37820 [Chromobacterium haemolyticum]
MGKNIIYCADGTWNGAGNDNTGKLKSEIATNVVKLYNWIAGDNSGPLEQSDGEYEKKITQGNSVTQIAKYIHGVGDDDNFLARMLDGMTGYGLMTQIIRGYTFISRNYHNGDNIYILGFSRGAYAARALAGLICSQGLLAGDHTKEDAYKLGCTAWYRYQNRNNNSPIMSALHALFAGMSFTNLIQALTANQIQFISTNIYAVAVWDTVGAMGIPAFNDTNQLLDTFQFADLDLSTKVSYGLHAISLDEKRKNFIPTLWNYRDGVTQVLLPGAHADVGGGYPISNNESGLSDGSLLWMKSQLSALPSPIIFGSPPKDISADPLAVAHQEWDGIQAILHSRTFPKSQNIGRDTSVTQRLGRLVRVNLNGPLSNYNPKNLV